MKKSTNLLYPTIDLTTYLVNMSSSEYLPFAQWLLQA